jgi:predicted ArsR family transcriptional regulator
MSETELKAISGKLDLLIRLEAAALIEGRKQNDQLFLLSKAGFQPKTIAEILGTTPNTVRVQLSKLRKKKR